jgi:hypothetical protein
MQTIIITCSPETPDGNLSQGMRQVNGNTHIVSTAATRAY